MKRIISLILAFLMLASISVIALADEPCDTNSAEDEKIIITPGEPTRPEETIWYFRTYNGVNQMRLWSITYRKWLTDWIDIGPA